MESATQIVTQPAGISSIEECGASLDSRWGVLVSKLPGISNVDLYQNKTMLGRKAECDVTFSDPRVSGTHCQVIRDAEESGKVGGLVVFVEDLSANGTFINDTKIGKGKRMLLRHGDSLSLALPSKAKAAQKSGNKRDDADLADDANNHVGVYIFHDNIKYGTQHAPAPRSHNHDYITARPVVGPLSSGGAPSSSSQQGAGRAAAASAPAAASGVSSRLAETGAGAGADPVRLMYDIRDTIGAGNFSEVKLGVSLETGKKYAIKIIDKTKFVMQPNFKQCIKEEIDILTRVKHENVIYIKEVFETKRIIYMVLELVEGGELFNHIVNNQRLSEPEARYLFRQIVEGVHHLHSRGIVHRDLKPENLLLAHRKGPAPPGAAPTSPFIVKISDFGLSKVLGFDKMSQKMGTVCGTPQYLAPEVIMHASTKEGYQAHIDMWALGVILFVMLCGYAPFDDSNQASLFDQIRKGQYTFDERYWSNISAEAKDLVTRLMCVDPTKRISSADALQHPWLRKDKEEGVQAQPQQQPQPQPQPQIRSPQKPAAPERRPSSTKKGPVERKPSESMRPTSMPAPASVSLASPSPRVTRGASKNAFSQELSTRFEQAARISSPASHRPVPVKRRIDDDDDYERGGDADPSRITSPAAKRRR
jgi:serine/threonine protein kinase